MATLGDAFPPPRPTGIRYSHQVSHLIIQIERRGFSRDYLIVGLFLSFLFYLIALYLSGGNWGGGGREGREEWEEATEIMLISNGSGRSNYAN